MQARMKNPVFILPEAMKALFSLDKATEKSEGLPQVTRKLVHLRASQINGCSVCVHMHSGELKKADVSDDRIFAVAAWRDTPFFTDQERAALALTEELTRIADRADPVSDAVWEQAAQQFDEEALAALILQISLINVWNRLNASVRQVAGDWG
ncbi:carboxymuconolactone decarboxylase family protein [Roseibium sp. M-1]